MIHEHALFLCNVAKVNVRNNEPDFSIFSQIRTISFVLVVMKRNISNNLPTIIICSLHILLSFQHTQKYTQTCQHTHKQINRHTGLKDQKMLHPKISVLYKTLPVWCTDAFPGAVYPGASMPRYRCQGDICPVMTDVQLAICPGGHMLG